MTERKTPPTPRVQIRASFARLAATARAVNDIRYYLGGILVEPRKEGGAYVVATNGHHLLAAIDPKAVCEAAVIINPDAAILRACPRISDGGDTDECVLRLTEFEERPALVLTDKYGLPARAQMWGATIEAATSGEGTCAFPNWRRVLPEFDKLKLGCVGTANANYLQAPMTAFGGRQAPFVECLQESDQLHKKFVRRLYSRKDIIHVVMCVTADGNSRLFGEAWRAVKGGA